jgi:hypothetical protein
VADDNPSSHPHENNISDDEELVHASLREASPILESMPSTKLYKKLKDLPRKHQEESDAEEVLDLTMEDSKELKEAQAVTSKFFSLSHDTIGIEKGKDKLPRKKKLKPMDSKDMPQLTLTQTVTLQSTSAAAEPLEGIATGTGKETLNKPRMTEDAFEQIVNKAVKQSKNLKKSGDISKLAASNSKSLPNTTTKKPRKPRSTKVPVSTDLLAVRDAHKYMTSLITNLCDVASQKIDILPKRRCRIRNFVEKREEEFELCKRSRWTLWELASRQELDEVVFLYFSKWTKELSNFEQTKRLMAKNHQLQPWRKPYQKSKPRTNPGSVMQPKNMTEKLLN